MHKMERIAGADPGLTKGTRQNQFFTLLLNEFSIYNFRPFLRIFADRYEYWLARNNRLAPLGLA